MGKIIAAITCFFFASCCFMMYSWIPPSEGASDEWADLIRRDNHEKMNIVLVAPGQEDENLQRFVSKVADILANSGTSYCKTCRSLSNYSFAYEKTDSNDFSIVDVIQLQRGICKKNRHDSCEYVYRDMYNIIEPDSSTLLYGTDQSNWRYDTISYYIPKEHLVKENVFYLAFTKCDIRNGRRDFYFDCRYSVWDSKNDKFFERGMLGPVFADYENDAAKYIADILVIALGLQ